MTSDVYQAPQSEILTEQATNSEFYVVSSRKFLILFFATLGTYAIYWFYKHWSQFKIHSQEAMWPVMRAIFAIFFVHSLFELFRIRALERNKELKFSANL